MTGWYGFYFRFWDRIGLMAVEGQDGMVWILRFWVEMG